MPIIAGVMKRSVYTCPFSSVSSSSAVMGSTSGATAPAMPPGAVFDFAIKNASSFTTTKYSMLQSGAATRLVTEYIDYDDNAERYQEGYESGYVNGYYDGYSYYNEQEEQKRQEEQKLQEELKRQEEEKNRAYPMLFY